MPVQNDPTSANDPAETTDHTGVATVVDGDVAPIVYYRRGQVIAVGTNARDWVSRREPSAAVATLWEGRNDEGEPAGSPPEPAYRFTVRENPEAMVEVAQAAGHHVQLSHVFIPNVGVPTVDTCCDKTSKAHYPTKAAPYRASPYRASSSPQQTSADKADSLEIPLLGGPIAESDRPMVKVWIMDTGIMANGIKTPLLDRSGYIKGDGETDHPESVAPPGVDPVAGHGTFIAGIIEQLTPGCDILISGVIKPSGEVDEPDLVEAIYKLLAEDHSIALWRTILNLSFSGGLNSPSKNLLGNAIAAAQADGVLVVAAAGNGASCRPVYPAHFKDVVAVAALDHEGSAAEFTNRGSWVEACALGVDIVSTFFHWPTTTSADFAGWAVWSGTSFAAPVVVAAIAEKMAEDPNMSAVTARTVVLAGVANPCLGFRVEFGDSLKAKDP